MKNLLYRFSGLIVVLALTSCATARKAPEPLVQKPRDITTVYFDFDKSQLVSEERVKITQLVERLKDHPHWIVQLEGNTDALGAANYNVKLGDSRARSVKQAFVLQGVSPEQLIILSFGEEKPIASNSEEVGRLQNRRVDIKIR